MRDAVRRDAAAGYGTALVAPVAGPTDVAVVSAQLGREARGTPAVVHRCGHGLPTVVRVAPRLEDGTPFPTLFWLSCPVLRAAVGRLEAEHLMVALTDRLTDDAAFAADYAASSDRYVAARDALGVVLDGAPTAGGMPARIKCLHVHVAHHLATGDNVVGAAALDALLPLACPAPCVPDAPSVPDAA